MSAQGRKKKLTIGLRPEVYAELVVYAERVGVSLPMVVEGSLVRVLRREGVPLPPELERSAWWFTR